MKKIKLNKFKNKMSQDADVFTSAFLDSSIKEIPSSEINYIIDNNEVYINEKDKSNIYRVMVNVKPVLTNILPSLSLTDGIGLFNNSEFKDVLNPINGGVDVKTKITFKDSYFKNLKNKDGWLGYHKIIGLNRSENFTELGPKKHDIELFDEDDFENWTFSLYYINKKEYVSSTKGIPLISLERLDYGNRTLECILTVIDHNLNIGDRVYVGGLTEGNGEYKVLDVGNFDNKNKRNYFVIDLPNTASLTKGSFVRRVVNGVQSEYFYRYIKKVPTVSGRILNNNSYKTLEAGFSQTIYGDKIGNVFFHEDIDLSDLRDHMNRPPLEIIFTAFKERKTKTGVNYFTTLNSALNLNDTGFYTELTPNVKKINSNTYNHPKQSNLSIYSNEIIYDIVEYNSFELSEYQLNKINFRFNLIDRESTSSKTINDNGVVIDLGIRNEGYYYDPFLSIPILSESEYTESGDEFDEIPYHAVKTDNGYIWRDILSKSSNTNFSYPYLNGVHNVMVHYNLLQKRQDPFGVHGLRYDLFPADLPGEENTLKTDDSVFNNINNEC